MTAILWDSIYKEHRNHGHPESFRRLDAILDAVKSDSALSDVRWLRASAATTDPVLAIHTEEYVRNVKQWVEAGVRYLDPDTQVCDQSYRVALAAVGGSLDALDKMMRGELKRAFFAVRPPGHHAEADRSAGFCLFNNIAIAARHLQREHRVGKVAIYDFDVHHGNGTMHSFWNDPSVLYVSIHQWPHVPGTGMREDRGGSKARGTIVNFPYPPGAGHHEYIEATERFIESASAFKPDAILLSAGFDAHYQDPLAGHSTTEETYAEIGRMLRVFADETTAGRLAAFLEGGYNLDALGASVTAMLREWVD